MLYRWLVPLSHRFELFNVFRYPSFRMVAAMMLSLLLGILLGPWFIRDWPSASTGNPMFAPTPRSTIRRSKALPPWAVG